MCEENGYYLVHTKDDGNQYDEYPFPITPEVREERRKTNAEFNEKYGLVTAKEEYERKFCKMFFSKKYNDRVFGELDSYYSRNDGIKRIVSDCAEMLDLSVICRKYDGLPSKKEIMDFLGNDNCYCISFNEQFDETYIEIKRYFEKLYGKETYILFKPYKKCAYIEYKCSDTENTVYFLCLKEK